VKVEKIPQLLTAADCADNLKSQQAKENPGAFAETVEMPSTIDDTSETSISSGSSLHSPCPKKLKYTEDTFHLTTQKLGTVRASTAKIEDDGLSRTDGSGQGPAYEEVKEEAAAWISCANNPEAEDSHSDVAAGVEHQPNAQQDNSASTSKSGVNVSAAIDNKSHVGVESLATSEMQNREKIKPKVVKIRRANDVPDRNCKTQ